MGLFDDLIPQQGSSSTGLFDDLIPSSSGPEIPSPFEDTEMRQRSRRRADLMDEQLALQEPESSFSKSLAAIPLAIGSGLNMAAQQVGGAISGAARAAEELPFLPPSLLSVPAVRDFASEQGRLISDYWGGQSRGKQELVAGLNQGPGGETISDIAEIAAASAPSMAAAPAGLSAAAGAAALQGFGGTFNEAASAYEQQGIGRDRAEGEALLPAAISGAITGAITRGFGRTGIESLAARDIARSVGEGTFSRITKSALKNYLAEASEEGLDQAAQSVLEMASFNPEMSLEEAISNTLTAAGAGGVLGAGAGAVASGFQPTPPPVILPPEIRQAETAGLTRSAQAAREVIEREAARPVEPAAEPVKGEPDAESNKVPEEVYGNVRQGEEATQGLPTTEGGAGVPSGGQAQNEVLLRATEELKSLPKGTGSDWRIIEIEKADGTREMGAYNNQEMLGKPYVARWNPTLNKWSHGLIGKGETLLDAPSDPAVMVLRDLPGTSGTREAMQIGATVPKEAIPQLEKVLRDARAEDVRIRSEIDSMPNPTESDLARTSLASNRANILSEALEAARGGRPESLTREVIPVEEAQGQVQEPQVLSKSPTGAEVAPQPVRAGTEAPVVSEIGPAETTAKALADRLREQFKTPATQRELGTFGVVPKVINAAVEVAAKIIEAGGTTIDAINAAVEHIKANHKGRYFNEAEFRTYAESKIGAQPTVAGAGEPTASGSGVLPPERIQGGGTGAESELPMRKSAERATTSPQIPEPVQQRIAEAPESRYEPQSMRRVEDVVTTMSEGDLATVGRDSDLYTAARLEQAQRRFREGDNDGGYRIFEELEREGTRFGQLINQFKLLTSAQPENVARLINQKLTKAGKDPLTPDQERRVIDLTTNSKKADAELDVATQEWVNNPTNENAAIAERLLDNANSEALKLQQLVNKFQPKTTSAVLKSILQGNLLTPISEVANLVGNLSFLPFRAASRATGTGIDIIDSFFRGKPREVAAQPISGTAQAASGAARGLKQIPSILARGTGETVQGETRAGLHPLRAWANQFAKNPDMPTTGGKVTISDRVNLLLEGTFGIPAEIMLRGLGAGDAPFRKAAEARVIAEQLRLNKVPKAQWDFAQKFPELFFDRAKMEQIRNDAASAIFQGKSGSLDTINRFIRNNWLTQRGVSPDFLDLLVSTVAPYRLTPWKITGEILSFNPLVALGRTIFEAKKGNSRAAKLNAGKMVVGGLLTGAAYWLYDKGLLAPSMDDRTEAQKARVLLGEVLPPNHINISGLERASKKWAEFKQPTPEDFQFRPGDDTRDVFRAGGVAGAMMYLVANTGREFERKPQEARDMVGQIGGLIRQSTLEQARFAMNQSYLSGIEGLLTAIKDGGADNWLRQWMSTTISIPLPNTLSTLSRATRQYKPDFKAAEFSKQVENLVRNRLGFAGLDDYLPLKRGLWGEPLLETPKNRNEFFYHFFDISKGKQVTDDPVALELYRLWRKTGKTEVIPSLPESELVRDSKNYPLSPELHSRYAELIGQQRRLVMDRIIVNPEFHKRSDEQKIKLLERVYREGMDRGKALFWREHGAEIEATPLKAGFSPGD